MILDRKVISCNKLNCGLIVYLFANILLNIPEDKLESLRVNSKQMWEAEGVCLTDGIIVNV